MAKKKDRDKDNSGGILKDISNETMQVVMAIFAFLIALIAILASFGKAGPIGHALFGFFTKAFGLGYYLIPVSFVMLGISFIQGMKQRFGWSKVLGALLFFLAGLGILGLMPNDGHTTIKGVGGLIGYWISTPLIRLIDVWATTALLLAIFTASIFITFNVSYDHIAFWRRIRERMQEKEKKQAEMDLLSGAKEKDSDKESEEEADGLTAIELAKAEAERMAALVAERSGNKNKPKGERFEDDGSEFTPAIVMPLSKPYNPPPLSLLEKDSGKAETGDIKARANIIKRTLQNFGITVEMDEISIGPTVTRYALKPAEGVKLARIVALNNDLAMALAAHPIRIEAPIPGKSLVGIEVPNTAKATVGLATLLGSAEFANSDKPLLVSLGKDITGKGHFANLGKAPHALIAGATGSGKSVTIHTLITSLLYRNSPENLKFIMIDPKRVELTLYNKIPHLLTPVITDPKKTIMTLKWAGKEMARRYDILEKHQARDIDSYHRNVVAPFLKKDKNDQDHDSPSTNTPDVMPYIVIIIDELADIMQSYPRELESAIVRLAQMSRAVGIHLVISTQRPSVNVITGLIKANIPTRVALQVASQIDSRTILDQPGAEKLLGAGDMLYLGGEMAKPVRLQSAFITENEVKKVVKYLREEYKDAIIDEINLTPPEAGSSSAFDSMADNDFGDEEEDDMYESAKQTVLSTNKASTSFLQRKLGIGYSRAAKLIDMMEQRGVVGPSNGSKPREVYGGSVTTSTAGEAGIGDTDTIDDER